MLGSIAMAMITSLIGVFLLLRRQSLMGEVISHAAFPGIVLGVSFMALFLSEESEMLNLVLFVGGFFFALLGLGSVRYLEKRRISSDAASCFVLASFFGIGILLASRIQNLQTAWYRQALVFLYGQAATMTDFYLPIYAILSVATLLLIIVLYPQMKAFLFDPTFARILKIKTDRMVYCLNILVALSVVIGMRSVGVVLMAGMLIAPGIAARPWCRRLSSCLILALFFGVVSAVVGNILSLEGTKWLHERSPEWRFSLPTGPLILLVCSLFCFISLLFAPRGALFCLLRRWLFRRKIVHENLLKAFWKRGKGVIFSQNELSHTLPGYRWPLLGIELRGWVARAGCNGYLLTELGWKVASRIVRRHRLWEGYLVNYLGQGADRVHKSAEEFEHLSDEDLEEELEQLLGNLERDPHAQLIPQREKPL
jgi:manganese/zinc/iron transport system permease protein